MKNEIKVVGGIGKKCNKGKQYHNQNRVYDNKLATCVNTAFNPYYVENGKDIERERDEFKN